MDNTSKLEQLKAQRRELDRQIKELSHPKYEVDGAKLVFKTYKTCREDEWVVTLEEINATTHKTSSYKQIISAKSKDDAIEYIETQIATLQTLLDKVKESTYENNC